MFFSPAAAAGGGGHCINGVKPVGGVHMDVGIFQDALDVFEPRGHPRFVLKVDGLAGDD